MKGVVFYLEPVTRSLYGGNLDTFEMLSNTALAFGFDWYAMIDRTNIRNGVYFTNPMGALTYRYYTSLDEVFADNPGATFVGMERASTLLAAGKTPEPLPTFVHPVGDMIYIPGMDGESNAEYLTKPFAHWLTIGETVDALWSHIALSVVMYDRWRKAQGL